MLFFLKSACDFLGETLAGILGLNAAKYQYAIDQYHRDHKVKLRRQNTTCQNITFIFGFSPRPIDGYFLALDSLFFPSFTDNGQH